MKGYTVVDLAWCAHLSSFLVLTENKLFTFEPLQFKLTEVTQVNGELWAVTNHATDVFLVHRQGTTIERFSLPSWRRVKSWTKFQICDENSDNGIRCLAFDSQVYAALILQKDLHWRVDTFDCNMEIQRRGPALSAKASQPLGYHAILSAAGVGSFFLYNYDTKTSLIVNGELTIDTKESSKIAQVKYLSASSPAQDHFAAAFDEGGARIEVRTAY